MKLPCWLSAHDHPRPWEPDYGVRERILGHRDQTTYYVQQRYCRRCGWHDDETANEWKERPRREDEWP